MHSVILLIFFLSLQLCEVSAVGDPEPGTFAATGEAEQRKQGAEQNHLAATFQTTRLELCCRRKVVKLWEQQHFRKSQKWKYNF